MKPNLKLVAMSLIALLASLSMVAGTPVKKPMPKVAEEDILIKVPNRFYYFDDYDLHCYNTKNGTDTHINDFEGSRARTDAWYDPISDCVFFILDTSGTMISNKWIYRLTDNNILEEIIELTESPEGLEVKVSDDYVYLKGYVDECIPYRVPGAVKNNYLSACYSLGMFPWKMSKSSLDLLRKPDVSFYMVNSPGVNVRTYGSSENPRLGYFKTRPGYEEEAYMTYETDEVDPRVFTKTFIPWHPAVGEVFLSAKKSYIPDGWNNITIENEFSTNEGYISSKFVKKLEQGSITGMQDIPAGELKERIYKMNSVKYPGVWLMIDELPMCGEAPLFIGKEIDGMVVFKWRAGWPLGSGEAGKRIHLDDNNTVFYGREVTKNEYELDLSKINDTDLETLFKVAEPMMQSYPVLVKIQEKGVKTFSVSD